MRSSVVTFDSRLQRRFAYLADETSRHARTDAESVRVERLMQAVHTGHVSLRDGHAALAQLRRDQQAERRAA